MARLLGDDGHRLDPRRSGADHADPQAGEINRLTRPVAGMVDLALEIAETLDIGHSRVRQAAGREHEVVRRHSIAVRRRHRPAAGTLVECRTIDARIEAMSGRRSKWSATWLAYRKFPAAARSARSSPTPAAIHRRTNRSTGCSRRRTARRDTGSSTRCRRHHRPAHRPGPTIRAHGAGAACTCRQTRHRPRRRRRSRCQRRCPCRRWIARQTLLRAPSEFALGPKPAFYRPGKSARAKTARSVCIFAIGNARTQRGACTQDRRCETGLARGPMMR